VKLLVLVVAALLTLAIGIRVYEAFSTPDRLTCLANEFNFGCYTPWGWATSLGAAVAVAAAIYAWERFRDK
jgi:hypothetical protein